MKEFFLLSLYLLFTSAPTLAAGPEIKQADCIRTDIRATNPKFKNNPALKEHFSIPRNQDSIGWCYAFAAADLQSVELGFPVSSMHTSIIYNHHHYTDLELRQKAIEAQKVIKPNYKEVYEGGQIGKAIELVAKNKWICTEQGLPFDVMQTHQTHKMILNLESLKRLAIESKPTSENLCYALTQVISPFRMTSLDTQQIAASLIREDMNLTLDAFATKACTQKIINVPEMKIIERNKDSSFFNSINNYMHELNAQLSKAKPVSIVFNINNFTALGKGEHANVVIGRRWKNGKCEFNLRNSWGQSCAAFRPGIDCNKQEGSFWVSDAQLFNASTSIQYIK